MVHSRRLAIFAALAVLLIAPAILLGRPNDQDKGTVVTGTVSSVDASNITVKTNDGDKAVPLNDKTKYTKGDNAAAIADVQPGMAVVVHVAPDGSAKEVRIAPATTPK